MAGSRSPCAKATSRDFRGCATCRRCPLRRASASRACRNVAALLPCVDHVILDAHHLGGITPWLKAAAIVEAANLPISAHSHPLVHVHLLAAKRMGAWLEYMPWWDMLFVDPPQPQDGVMQMSARAGPRSCAGRAGGREVRRHALRQSRGA